MISIDPTSAYYCRTACACHIWVLVEKENAEEPVECPSCGAELTPVYQESFEQIVAERDRYEAIVVREREQ